MVRGSLFLRNLFSLFRSDINLFLVFGRLPEVSDPFSKPFADLREFSCTENDQDDDQDDEQLRHSYPKHPFLLLNRRGQRAERLEFLRYALCALKLAEVHGNRTHRGHLLPATGFEVQEAHQDLTTSIFQINRFSF